MMRTIYGMAVACGLGFIISATTLGSVEGIGTWTRLGLFCGSIGSLVGYAAGVMMHNMEKKRMPPNDDAWDAIRRLRVDQSPRD